MDKNHFKLYFIILSFFFISYFFFLHKAEAGQFCKCVSTRDYTNCYTEKGLDVYFGPNIWSCTIFKTEENCCDPSKCGGESPCCYGCSYPDNQLIETYEKCDGLKSLCQNYVCPDTTDYNGRTCELIAPCSDGWGVPHCKGIYGKWDASKKQCVTCDLVKHSKLKKIVDTTQKCYTRLGGIWPEKSCRGWKEESCASISPTCESACGGNSNCDDQLSKWCVGSVAWKRDCINCNTYIVKNCKDLGLGYYCYNGDCVLLQLRGTSRIIGAGCPILKIFDDNKLVTVEKLDIHSPKDQDTIATTTFNMKPINGKYEIILDEAAYLFWDGSHINSVKLTDGTGKECKLISATHSKQGDVLSAITTSDDVRVRTLPGERITLTYDGCSGNQFTFSIEGYNRKLMWAGLDVTSATLTVIVIVLIVIAIIFVSFKFFSRKK